MAQRKFIKVAIFAVMLTVATSLVTSAYADKIKPKHYVYINVETYLRLRDSPQGNIVGQVKVGTKVYVLSGPDRNHYYKIRYKGEEYYVYGGDDWEYLILAKDQEFKKNKNEQKSKTKKRCCPCCQNCSCCN